MQSPAEEEEEADGRHREISAASPTQDQKGSPRAQRTAAPRHVHTPVLYTLGGANFQESTALYWFPLLGARF